MGKTPILSIADSHSPLICLAVGFLRPIGRVDSGNNHPGGGSTQGGSNSSRGVWREVFELSTQDRDVLAEALSSVMLAVPNKRMKPTAQSSILLRGCCRQVGLTTAVQR